MAAQILLALLLVAGIQVTIQQTCHMKDLQACALKFTEFAKDNHVPLPTNEEELDKQCVILQAVGDCVYNYSLKCVSELGRTVGNLMLSSTGDKMRTFCQTGHDLNSKYLRNAKCIGDNYDGVTPCAKTALAAIESLPKKSWKDRLPTFCCTVGQFRSCLGEHYLKTCNQEVVELLDVIIEFGLSDVGFQACIAVENAVTCPELPPPGTPLDGTYNNNILGMLVGSFLRE